MNGKCYLRDDRVNESVALLEPIKLTASTTTETSPPRGNGDAANTRGNSSSPLLAVTLGPT